MQHGMTALHKARSADIAKILLHGKADVNAVNKVSVSEAGGCACVYLSKSVC